MSQLMNIWCSNLWLKIIGHTFMEAFAYAENIILPAPTKQSMHGMLKLANLYSKD